jgi:hypothetical protein
MAMVTALHTKTETNPVQANGCFVGVLDVCEVQDRDYTNYLSADERAKYSSLRGERRQGEWLAGRLVAKHLFLNRLEMSQAMRSETYWSPALAKLSAAALGVYSPWMYRKIEVLAQDEKPSFVWCGKKREESISLSHAGGIACASLAEQQFVAIDVETTAHRNGAFYRKTFTEVEKNWVARVTGGELSSSNWHFTLLWTLKESALKLGWLNGASIWNLPRIEIDGLPDVNRLGSFWCDAKMGDAFLVFTASIRDACRAMQVQAAVAGTRNFVLTVMNPLIGAVN